MPDPNVDAVSPAESGGDVDTLSALQSETVPSISPAEGGGNDKILPTLQSETEAYVDFVRELERKRKPGEGIFGLKGGPADNPCHERFDQTVGQLLQDFAARKPASDTVRAVMEALFAAPKKYASSAPACAYWMLIAVQRHSLPLIDLLSSEGAFALYVRLNQDIPRRERLPVQTEILKKLKKQC